MKKDNLYLLFGEKSKRSIDYLFEDTDFKKILPLIILEKFTSDKKIVLPIDDDFIKLIFSRVDFADEYESFKIANFFKKYFNYKGRFLPLSVDFLEKVYNLKKDKKLIIRDYNFVGEDFASRCLFSLSFFYEALDSLYKRRGAPHPYFYRELGRKTFEIIGEESIAEHFESWDIF
ncbi:MAG: hypothetical protein QXG18_02475 [Candidatus Pacearchaeota archaeon]